ncbi:MAG: helix-turn-helix protein [Hymenobacter sp.]|nr:helix-turn-helix protein [Hymenobacter sp.]
MNPKQIPLLNPAALGVHHFSAWAEWQTSALNNLFHINRLETHVGHIPFPLAPHRKTVHDFVFITKGATKRSKGLDEYEIGDNTFFFLPATQITTHEFMTPDTEGFYCHFDIELLTKGFVHSGVLSQLSFLQFTGNPVVHISPEALGPVVHILRQLERAENINSPESLDLIRVYLLALFTELKPFANPDVQPGKNAAVRITQLYKDALAQHIYEKHSVAAYAELLAVSPNHLNKCVKTVTGKSAQDTLDEMVLLEAKALLKQSTLTISEIAFKLGKEDPSSFSRFFRLKTNSTPKAYKLSASEGN